MISGVRCTAYMACISILFQSFNPLMAGVLSHIPVDSWGDATSFHVCLLSSQGHSGNQSALEITGWKSDLFATPRIQPEKPETCVQKTHLWSGRPVAFSFGGITLEWLDSQLFQFSETYPSELNQQKSAALSSLTFALPNSKVLLRDLDVDCLTVKAAQTFIQEGVSVETLKTSSDTWITPQGSLVSQNLSILKGTFFNEGKLSSAGPSTIHVNQKACLLNKGIIEHIDATWWHGKGRVVNRAQATLAFADTATLSDLSITNKGLLTAASLLGGSIASLQNSGTVSAQTWSDFVISKLSNNGTLQGHGNLILAGRSRNDHYFSCDLHLTLQDMFTNTERMEIKELKGIGTLNNTGDVIVNQALPPSILYQNKGYIQAPSYDISSDRAQIFFESGKWKLNQLTALKSRTPLTLKGSWDVEQVTNQGILVNTGQLTLKNLKGAGLPFTNKGLLQITGGGVQVGDFYNAVTGSVQGKGVLNCKSGINDGIINGEDSPSLYKNGDYQNYEALYLFVREKFQNNHHLKAWSLGGLHSQAQFQNQEHAFFQTFPNGCDIQNKGLIEVPSYMASPKTDAFLKQGRWRFQFFSIPSTISAYTLDGNLEIGKLFFTGKTLNNRGNVTLDTFINRQISLTNYGSFTALKQLTLAKLLNINRLKGSGHWCVDTLQNNVLFETFGTHRVTGKRLANTHKILSSDTNGSFIYEGEEFLNGEEPKDPKRALKLAQLSLEGKVSLQTRQLMDNRYGTLFAGKEVTLKGGELLNGAPLAAVPKTHLLPYKEDYGFFSTSSVSDPYKEDYGFLHRANFWSRPISYRSYGSTQASGAVCDFFHPNGAYIASGGELKVHVSLFHNTFGMVFSQSPFEIEASEEVFFKSGRLDGKARGLIRTPILKILREEPHEIQRSYHPIPCFPIWGNCPEFCLSDFLETSDESRLLTLGDLNLEVLQVLVEGSQLLSASSLFLNKTLYTGTIPPGSSLQVNTSKAGSIGRFMGREGLLVNIGGVDVTGNVMGLFAHINTDAFRVRGAKPYSGVRALETGPITINLREFMEGSSQRALSHRASNGRLSLPWERSSKPPRNNLALAFWGERPTLARTLSLSPSLLAMALREAAFQYLGLEALDPHLMLRLTRAGRRLALQGRSDVKTPSSRAVIPYHQDLSQAQSFLACQIRNMSQALVQGLMDPILHLVPRAEALHQGHGTVWGNDQAHLNVRGPLASEGGLLGAGGEREDALVIQAEKIGSWPIIRTTYDPQTQEIREVLDKPPTFLTPNSNMKIFSKGDQVHVAPLAGAQTQIDFESREGDLTFPAQPLYGETRTQTTHRSGGLLGKKTQETHVRQTVSHAVTHMLVKEGGVGMRTPQGKVDATAPRIKTKGDIVFDTPQSTPTIRVARDQIRQESHSVSTGFFENKVQASGSHEVTPQEAQLKPTNGKVRFITNGQPALVETSGQGDLKSQVEEAGPCTILPQAHEFSSYHHEECSLGVGVQAIVGIGLAAVTGGLSAPVSVLESAASAAVTTLGTSAIGNAYAGRPLLRGDDLRNALPTIASAGLTAGVLSATGYVAPMAEASSLTQLSARAHHAAAHTAAHTLVDGVQGNPNLGANLLQGAVNLAQGVAAHEIGVFHHGDTGRTVPSLALHGAVGAGAAAAVDSDMAAGAVGGVVGELAGQGLRAGGVTETPGIALSQAAAVLTAGVLNRDVERASASAANAARENAFMVLPVAIGAGLTAYELYEAYQIYQDQGREAALKHLGITVAATVAGGAVLKVGGKVVGRFVNTQAAFDAALTHLPGFGALVKATESGLQALSKVEATLVQKVSHALGTKPAASSFVAKNVKPGSSGSSGLGPKNQQMKVVWVDEKAEMGVRARSYNDSALGARSNAYTKNVQAPSLKYTGPDGRQRVVRFDGIEKSILIDRKIAIVTTDKAKNQALRQAEALSQNGFKARWEVPNQTQEIRARRMLEELNIHNIEVAIIHVPKL